MVAVPLHSMPRLLHSMLPLLHSMLPLLLLLGPTPGLASSRAPSPCRPDLLAVYRLTLATSWDEATFPRQYPLWRPPAQWSKTLGFSHTEDFRLFSLGQAVTEGVKEFVETGESRELDSRRHNSSLLDSFTGPPILSGTGNSSARLFLDGRHTRVSLLTKLVPSPDWFVGLDSLDLCRGGRFIDSLTLEADPLDAGTDNGFTFTSPNWPTEPAGGAFRITSSYPPHPAGSFHYPHLERLPSIATFHFVKEAEYSLSRQFGSAEDAPSAPAPRRKRKLVLETAASPPGRSAARTSTSGLLGKRPDRKLALAGPLGLPDKAELYQTILRSYPGHRQLAAGRRRRVRGDRRAHRRHRDRRAKQDCRVGEWGAWGACSKTCDIGETTRARSMETPPRRAGRACPPLSEFRWCGSGNNCKEGYFGW